MRRLLLTMMATTLLAAPGMAQQAPMACVGIAADGRESLPGFNFAAVQDGRVTMLLTRNREGQSTVTDLTPVPTRPGVSFFLENMDVRFGDRPMSIFILTSIGPDGLILVERWLRDDQRTAEFTHHRLRCAP